MCQPKSFKRVSFFFVGVGLLEELQLISEDPNSLLEHSPSLLAHLGYLLQLTLILENQTFLDNFSLY